MRQRTLLTLVGGILLGAVLVAAQTLQPPTPAIQTPVSQNNVTTLRIIGGGQTLRLHADAIGTAGNEGMTLTGNVIIEVNGVTVSADKAAVKDGVFQLEGNVRMKAPTPPTP